MRSRAYACIHGHMHVLTGGGLGYHFVQHEAVDPPSPLALSSGQGARGGAGSGPHVLGRKDQLH